MRKVGLPLFLMVAVLVGLANSVRVFADPGSTATKPEFTIWKTIQLGTHKDATGYALDSCSPYGLWLLPRTLPHL